MSDRLEAPGQAQAAPLEPLEPATGRQALPDAYLAESEISRVERVARENLERRDAEVRAEVARDMAAREAGRLARAKADLATLMARIAHPERAENSLSWTPEVPVQPDYEASQCQGCGRRFPAVWSRAGHAVEAANQQPPRDRCVLWSLGLPVTSP